VEHVVVGLVVVMRAPRNHPPWLYPSLAFLVIVGGCTGYALWQARGEERIAASLRSVRDSQDRLVVERLAPMNAACTSAVARAAQHPATAIVSSEVGLRYSGVGGEQVPYIERWRIGDAFRLPYRVRDANDDYMMACDVTSPGIVASVTRWRDWRADSAGDPDAPPDH
jgi:hypothetical protein